MEESNKYLSEQIITYLGNKRSLLNFIGEAVNEVKRRTKKKKLIIGDVFSGSGVVSRYFKQYATELYVNDLEDYAKTINECYLSNKKDLDLEKINYYYKYLLDNLSDDKLSEGFITRLYCPQKDDEIKLGERVFFTHRNGMYIDTARKLIEDIPYPYDKLFLGNLLYEVSTKNNTGGVFKGFYKNSSTNKGQFGGNGKNALKRIMGDININKPVLSNFETNVHIYQGDSNCVVEEWPELDLAYMDPPYNQHPYSSNYFMLNLVNNYVEPKTISKVSGIPSGWNKSNYNNKSLALDSLKNICEKINAKYILISFNSEGFIEYEDMKDMLSCYGKVDTYEKEYNVFRASRNLKNRELYVKEFLFLLEKGCD